MPAKPSLSEGHEDATQHSDTASEQVELFTVMFIANKFDLQFQLPTDAAMVAMLHLHPSLTNELRSPDELVVEQASEGGIERVATESYMDAFGNRCTRFHATAGMLRLCGQNVVELDEIADPQPIAAKQHIVDDLPADVLQFLLASRYCEVDRFGAIACDLFGHLPPGGERAMAIRDWVHSKLRFDYSKARPTKTAMDTYTEREGVCRDFQHLAVTLSRAMNIPARYVTGYLGDIRVPYAGAGDFSAWYQVWLDGRWWDMDARHNTPRLGRVLMAAGRDAADVAITTSFGVANLTRFFVESNEVDVFGTPVLLPENSEPGKRAEEICAQPVNALVA